MRGGQDEFGDGGDMMGGGFGKKLHLNQASLKRVWDTSQRVTKDDWVDWMRHFAVELLRESPCAAH